MSDITFRDEVKMLRKEIAEAHENNNKKSKLFRLPSRAKLSNGKISKGYATVQVIKQNGAVEFTREPIVASTVKLEDTYHAVDGEDILTYKGKPFLIIPEIKKNPYNPNNGANETYGQKHIRNRMLNETIQEKKKIGGLGIGIGILIIAGIIVYALISG